MKNMHPSQITIGSITTVKKEPGHQVEMIENHGVFGDQTPNLLNVIARKGPLSPDQLGIRATQHVKAIANASGVKRTYTAKKGQQQQQLQLQQQQQQLQQQQQIQLHQQHQQHEVASLVTSGAQTVQIPQAQIVQAQQGQRAVDISFAPANVHPEMSKMPAGFSIFQVQDKAPQQIAVDQNGQVQLAAGTGYYQTQQGHVATHATAAHTLKPGELTTIPVTAWGWPVNIRSSPAKLEPTEGKHWENNTTYFRTTFS